MMPHAFAAPGLGSRPLGRAKAVTVQANKLIKGANRPATSKKGGSKKQAFDLNLQKLCSDPEYLPARQIGPVELAVKSGTSGHCQPRLWAVSVCLLSISHLYVGCC